MIGVLQAVAFCTAIAVMIYLIFPRTKSEIEKWMISLTMEFLVIASFYHIMYGEYLLVTGVI